ncbi:MAG: proprotein convertase P-domain-containing protein [Comamonadaceae bacterium]|nr:proprotein convertase P-domain-containing protein [Comamonadaceae bacterium]
MGLAETGQAASGSSAPGAAIPDKDPRGVKDTIRIDQEGVVKKLKVNVDISHSNIANLRVELCSPRGKRAVLHNRTGLGKKNLIKTYDSDSTASLAAF